MCVHVCVLRSHMCVHVCVLYLVFIDIVSNGEGAELGDHTGAQQAHPFSTMDVSVHCVWAQRLNVQRLAQPRRTSSQAWQLVLAVIIPTTCIRQ